MKNKFNSIDVCATVKELQRFVSLRVVNVYDIDNKTYLIKLSKPDTKAVILFESAVRIHSTEFDWPKNPAPSGFSMKLRKHVKGRRLEKIEQLGVDRIVDLQFGSGDASYHVIVELYDRGNVVLTDHEYTILNILRPRTDEVEEVKFAVRQLYPVHSVKQHIPPSQQSVLEMINNAKEGNVLKRVLLTNLAYGAPLIEHCLIGVGLKDVMKIPPDFADSPAMGLLMQALQEAEELYSQFAVNCSQGFIIQKSEKRVTKSPGDESELLTYNEYHPYLFRQHENISYMEFTSFSQAVDEFYSKMESQKLDMKVVQQEKAALKKLENVKKDHQKRIDELQKEQDADIWKGELIEMNRQLVDDAITVIRSAIANQIDWSEIRDLLEEAQSRGDPVAKSIKELSLDTNHITLMLRDPYETVNEDGSYPRVKATKVDIDLALGAYANSRRYFDKKKLASKKEQKTVESSNKALKSAERKTQQTLKDVATAATIHKARKTYWFEKFLWFISSENYLVISGRDQQQNEIIVKRYLRPGDVYVHADLHGAASVIIKNHIGGDIPPKTLNEAGTMAICHSAAWDAKVVTSAWYVHHDQVSKTAPTGEYLTTGSFMIRGKKNYLPPSYLIYGFALLFKLEEGSVFRHAGERRVKNIEDENSSMLSDENSKVLEEEDIDISDDSDDDEKKRDDESMDDVERNDGEAEDERRESTKVSESSGSYEEGRGSQGLDVVREETTCIRKFDTTGDVSRDSDYSVYTDNQSGFIERDSNSTQERAEDLNASVINDTENLRIDDSSRVIEFPDTSIALQHVSGSKFVLHREVSTSSARCESVSKTDPDMMPKDKGDHGRLSAKQRRDLKKKNKEEGVNAADLFPSPACDLDKMAHSKDGDLDSLSMKNQKETPTQVPLNRGQRRKIKKIKEKYADEDDEERELRMEILASAGSQKEKKKKGKGDAKSANRNRNVPKAGQKKGLEGMVLHDESLPVVAESERQDDNENVDDETDKFEEEKMQDDLLVNSLTGQPHGDDELLYVVPVCAPYQSLLNYKYKVKLLPGTTKKGKATKAALAIFQRDRSSTSRERDLMKILKDVDMARNIPGKVKVSAPNLQKAKK